LQLSRNFEVTDQGMRFRKAELPITQRLAKLGTEADELRTMLRGGKISANALQAAFG
jgi:hypothetical protein